MIHFLANQFRDWDHKVTSGMGMVAFAVIPSIEVLARLLGMLALATGIYCSISKEIRDRRNERERRRCRP